MFSNFIELQEAAGQQSLVTNCFLPKIEVTGFQRIFAKPRYKAMGIEIIEDVNVVHSCDECHYVEGCTDCYWADREDLRTQDKHLAAMFTSIAAQLGVCVVDKNGKTREQPVIFTEMFNAFTSMIKNSAEVVKEIMDVFSDEEGQAKLDQLEKKREIELEKLKERQGDIYGS